MYIYIYIYIFIYTCRQPLKPIAKANVRLHILPKQHSSNEAAMICLLIQLNVFANPDKHWTEMACDRTAHPHIRLLHVPLIVYNVEK